MIKRPLLQKKQNIQSGFTIPELIVVMALTVMFSGLILSFSLDFWGSSTSLQNSSETLVGRQNVGDALRERFNTASSLLNQNSIPDLNTAVPEPSDLTGTHWQILHAVPGLATMPSPGTISPILYYASPSVDVSKNIIMNGVNPFYDEFVLYLDGTSKTLSARSLANPGTTDNRVKTSCPTSTVSATCPEDRILANNVSGVSLRYFSRSGNLLDWSSITDPDTGAFIGPDFSSVEVVELTINFRKKATVKGSADSISNTIVRVALRNG
jgi:prepilin-type N-terminal cleavage/methylation domain-containing protein